MGVSCYRHAIAMRDRSRSEVTGVPRFLWNCDSIMDERLNIDLAEIISETYWNCVAARKELALCTLVLVRVRACVCEPVCVCSRTIRTSMHVIHRQRRAPENAGVPDSQRPFSILSVFVMMNHPLAPRANQVCPEELITTGIITPDGRSPYLTPLSSLRPTVQCAAA